MRIALISGLARHEQASLADLGLREHEDLQRLIRDDIGVLEDDLLVVAQAMTSTYTAFDAGYARNALIAVAEALAATPSTPDEQVDGLAKQLSGST
jgi:hypothetical protein